MSRVLFFIFKSDRFWKVYTLMSGNNLLLFIFNNASDIRIFCSVRSRKYLFLQNLMTPLNVKIMTFFHIFGHRSISKQRAAFEFQACYHSFHLGIKLKFSKIVCGSPSNKLHPKTPKLLTELNYAYFPLSLKSHQSNKFFPNRGTSLSLAKKIIRFVINYLTSSVDSTKFNWEKPVSDKCEKRTPRFISIVLFFPFKYH